jgi:hypothetical protein
MVFNQGMIVFLEVFVMAGTGGSLPKHGEAKKQRGIYTTTEAWQNLDKIADGFMLSKSELIEMIGRGRLVVIKAD